MPRAMPSIMGIRAPRAARGGEPVSGIVFLQVERPLVPERLRLAFVGTERTEVQYKEMRHWDPTADDNRYEYLTAREENRFHYTEADLKLPASYEMKKPLEPGKYVFPFLVPPLAQDLPGTLDSKHASIEYKLKATLETLGSASLDAEHILRVTASPYCAPSEAPLFPSEYEDVFACCGVCFNRGFLALAASSSEYTCENIAGISLNLSVAVLNRTSISPRRIDVEIRERVTRYATDQGRYRKRHSEETQRIIGRASIFPARHFGWQNVLPGACRLPKSELKEELAKHREWSRDRSKEMSREQVERMLEEGDAVRVRVPLDASGVHTTSRPGQRAKNVHVSHLVEVKVGMGWGVTVPSTFCRFTVMPATEQRHGGVERVPVMNPLGEGVEELWPGGMEGLEGATTAALQELPNDWMAKSDAEMAAAAEEEDNVRAGLEAIVMFNRMNK